LETELNDGNTRGETQVVVTVNGPGEVACWLYPLAHELKRRIPGVRICVAVVPCVFSSGAEADVLRTLSYVDAYCTIEETMKFIKWNKVPKGFRKKAPGFMLHLGGDSMFTIMLAKRLGIPALAYVERPLAFQFLFDRVFYSDFEKIDGLKESDTHKIVGEMMVDAALLRCPDRSAAEGGKPVVGLYPSSRMYLTKYVLPYYAAAAEKVARKMPEVEWVISKSDFVDRDFLRNLPEVEEGRPLEGVDLEWRREDDREFMVTPDGLSLEVLSPAQVAPRVNLALTVPGSNTAELATLGVPMILTLPTYKHEIAPLPGIAGHLGRLPVIGWRMKRFLAKQVLKRMKFLSHPNRRADRMVIPELIGELDAQDLADAIEEALNSDTTALVKELKAVMGPPGATSRLVSELENFLAETGRQHEIAPAH
jgi:lipid-A-disaccharide synthase